MPKERQWLKMAVWGLVNNTIWNRIKSGGYFQGLAYTAENPKENSPF